MKIDYYFSSENAIWIDNVITYILTPFAYWFALWSPYIFFKKMTIEFLENPKKFGYDTPNKIILYGIVIFSMSIVAMFILALVPPVKIDQSFHTIKILLMLLTPSIYGTRTAIKLKEIILKNKSWT